MRDQCFAELAISTIIPKYFKENKDSMQFFNYIGWRASPVDHDFIVSEPVLNFLNKVSPIEKAGFIRMEPNHCYDWHTDMQRGLSINMLMTPDHDSHTLFGNRGNELLNFPTIELHYKPDTFYLFNTQIPHMVINTDQPRYLFTVEFHKQKEELSYRDMFVACYKSQLINYESLEGDYNFLNEQE